MPRINQDLIAERLKLSRTTVSRSLANHPAISRETRARVLAAAEQLGYRNAPARLARRIRQRKQMTVGVVIGVPSKDVGLVTFPLILKGIHERATIEDVTVDVCYQDPKDFDPEARRNPVFGHIRGGDWRGTILIHPFSQEAVGVISRKISTVSVLEDYCDMGVDSIDTDHSAGIIRLVQELADRGHKRIGFLAWDYPVGGHWSRRRFAAYVEGLFTQGLEFQQDWALNVHKAAARFSIAQLAEKVAAKIRNDRVTAWVCAADHQAYQLIQDLRARGIRVPEDCSVTGFDGIAPPMGMEPVATLRVPLEDIGGSALIRVLNRIAHPHAPCRKFLVQAEFVEDKTMARAHFP